MATSKIKPANIDQYIAGFPKEVRDILQQIRAAVHQAAPGAEETIKYAMPTLMLKGDLVYFAAFKNHIGFYPAPTGHPDFEAALSAYKTGRGSVQFPLDKPMPLDLITRIVQFRLKTNRQGAAPQRELTAKEDKKRKKAVLPLEHLSRPAQRALAHAGIDDLQQLSRLTEKALLQLHGIGKGSLPPLKAALADQGLSFTALEKKG